MAPLIGRFTLQEPIAVWCGERESRDPLLLPSFLQSKHPHAGSSNPPSPWGLCSILPLLQDLSYSSQYLQQRTSARGLQLALVYIFGNTGWRGEESYWHFKSVTKVSHQSPSDVYPVHRVSVLMQIHKTQVHQNQLYWRMLFKAHIHSRGDKYRFVRGLRVKTVPFPRTSCRCGRVFSISVVLTNSSCWRVCHINKAALLKNSAWKLQKKRLHFLSFFFF